MHASMFSLGMLRQENCSKFKLRSAGLHYEVQANLSYGWNHVLLLLVYKAKSGEKKGEGHHLHPLPGQQNVCAPQRPRQRVRQRSDGLGNFYHSPQPVVQPKPPSPQGP